jgi:hypothetical protein
MRCGPAFPDAEKPGHEKNSQRLPDYRVQSRKESGGQDSDIEKAYQPDQVDEQHANRGNRGSPQPRSQASANNKDRCCQKPSGDDAGTYDRFEAMQGKNGTPYATGLPAFEAVESTARYARDLVKQFFAPAAVLRQGTGRVA